MQNFYDPADGNRQYAFNPDVVATAQDGGGYAFKTAGGVALGPYPASLVIGIAPPQSAAEVLAAAQVQQRAMLSAACAAAIIGGFQSSALGDAYSYPSDAASQANIVALATVGGSLWCAPNSGVWVFTAHTAAQAAQVLKDMIAHIQAQQSKYATMLAQISSATTSAAVQTITWQ